MKSILIVIENNFSEFLYFLAELEYKLNNPLDNYDATWKCCLSHIPLGPYIF